MLDECSAIATAEGFWPGDRSSSDARFIDHEGSPMTASMFRDVGGAPVEATT